MRLPQRIDCPELQKRGLRRLQENLPCDQQLRIPAGTIWAFFGKELMGKATAHEEGEPKEDTSHGR